MSLEQSSLCSAGIFRGEFDEDMWKKGDMKDDHRQSGIKTK